MKPGTEGVSKRVVVRRRRFTEEFKRQAVEQTLAPGASAAGIALKHQLNANVLFKWRGQYLRELATAKARPAALLPVTIEGSNAARPAGIPEVNPTDKPERCSALRLKRTRRFWFESLRHSSRLSVHPTASTIHLAGYACSSVSQSVGRIGLSASTLKRMPQ